MVRQMFHVCKLVHADLSEYNILYHEDHLWIIDVSQSVEHDHPSAFDFLRNDIKNVEDFFGRLGVQCLGLRRCFEFVIRDRLSEDDGVSDGDLLKSWIAEKVTSPDEDGDGMTKDVIQGEGPSNDRQALDAAHEESIFLHSFIPRTLNEVYDPERDVEKFKRGDDLIYADTIGLISGPERKGEAGAIKASMEAPDPIVKVELEGPAQGPHSDNDEGTESGDGQQTSEESEDGDDEDKAFAEKKPRGHRYEDKDAKKVRFNISSLIYYFSLYLYLRSVRSKSKQRRRKNGKQRYQRPRRSALSRKLKVKEGSAVLT